MAWRSPVPITGDRGWKTDIGFHVIFLGVPPDSLRAGSISLISFSYSSLVRFSGVGSFAVSRSWPTVHPYGERGAHKIALAAYGCTAVPVGDAAAAPHAASRIAILGIPSRYPPKSKKPFLFGTALYIRV